MIPASYYHNIYLVLVTIITLVVYNQYNSRNGFRDFSPSKTDSIAGGVALFFALFIGMRPVSYVFCDMANYALYYKVFYEGCTFVFDSEAENLIFDRNAWKMAIHVLEP